MTDPAASKNNDDDPALPTQYSMAFHWQCREDSPIAIPAVEEQNKERPNGVEIKNKQSIVYRNKQI